MRRRKRVAEEIEERSFVVKLLMGDGWTGVGAAGRTAGRIVNRRRHDKKVEGYHREMRRKAEGHGVSCRYFDLRKRFALERFGGGLTWSKAAASRCTPKVLLEA